MKKTNPWFRNFVLLAMMAGTATLAVAVRPSQQVRVQSSIGLATMIPENFSDWSVDQRITPILPQPDVEEKISRIYDETLARTYVDGKGRRVMLSISYGGDQTGRLRVHRPESCYSGQGFLVKKIGETELETTIGRIPIKRLTAQSGPRHEPITYWIRVGDATVTGLVGQRLTQLRFGLTGEIPDGLIFRVSSIGDSTDSEYALHDKFVNDLMQALPAKHQAVLVGKTASR